jgi:cytochrome c
MKTMLTLVAAAACMMAVAGANASEAEDLAKAKGCLKCHAVGEKKVGPSYKDIAAKYAGKSDAEAAVVAKLRDGKGHMKITASEAEIKTLVQWVLATK